jgi:hypothetical protein
MKYFIVGYCWSFYIIYHGLILAIVDYYIIRYCWLFYHKFILNIISYSTIGYFKSLYCRATLEYFGLFLVIFGYFIGGYNKLF